MTKTPIIPNLPRRAVLTGGALAVSLAAPSLAQGRLSLSMATSWGRLVPGPGVSAQRLAESIEALSGGRIAVKVYPAGERVPALGVFDAVANRSVDLGHTAAAFNAGKRRAAAMFTAVPFGMTPGEHAAWLYDGDGLDLWRDLYAPFNLVPLMASNTGPSMGGWFTKPIETLADMRGLRMRIAGLGGAVMTALGVSAVSLPPGEIGVGLKAGTIDAAEFAGPAADEALRLFEAARYYTGPGFHEPNGAAELLVNADVWAGLDPDLRAVLTLACRAEHDRSLAAATHDGALALRRMTRDEAAILRDWPEDVVEAAREASREVMQGVAAEDALSARIVDSYRRTQNLLAGYASALPGAYMAMRADG